MTKKVEVEIEFIPNMNKVDKAMKKYKSSELGTGGGGGGKSGGGLSGLASTGVIAGLAGGIGGAIGATLGSTLLDGLLGGFKGVMKVLEGIGKIMSLMVMPFANLLIPLLMPFLQLMLPVAKMLNLMLKPVMEDVAAAMKLAKEENKSPEKIMLAGTSAMVRGLADVMGKIFLKMLEAPTEEKDLTPGGIIEEGLSTGNPVNDFLTELGIKIGEDIAESEGIDIDKIFEDSGLNINLIDLGTGIGDWIQGIIDWFAEKKEGLDGILSGIWEWASFFSMQIQTWFFNKVTLINTVLKGVWDWFTSFVGQIADWFEDKTGISLTTELGKIWTALTGFIDGITNYINGLLGIDTETSDAGGESGGGGFRFPGAAEGGTVEKTGLAVIHKGETVTPSGEGGGDINIGITVNGGLTQDTINKVLKELEMRLQSKALSSGGFTT